MAMLLVTTLKTPTGSKVIYHDDIAVVTGTKSIDGNTGSSDYTQTNWHIDYPTGYNRNNCIVISFFVTISNSTNSGAYGQSPYASSNYVLGTVPRGVSFKDDDMNVFCCNPNPNAQSISYKIVLLKIS